MKQIREYLGRPAIRYYIQIETKHSHVIEMFGWKDNRKDAEIRKKHYERINPHCKVTIALR